jgi:NDP-sugar pyrophosphorylase family protein
MKAAIIAAGLGERLRTAGFAQPKPLVSIAGKPLIDYVLAAVAQAGVAQVACIVNQESRGIEEHCREAWPAVHFEFVRRTTPSSMESLFTLSSMLGDERFVLLTVDAVFAPAALRGFLAAADARSDAHGVLAVNGFVDDEKPLWVALDSGGTIRVMGPEAHDSGVVTAGFYVFDPVIFREVAVARARQFSALREFLGHLLASGYRMYGEVVPKTVDVDRPADIAVAEAFIRSGFAA